MKRRYYPSLDDFTAIFNSSRSIPVYRDILADTDTPVSAFMKIDDGGDAFLFESVEKGEKWGRYSFIGVSPVSTFRGNGDEVEISDSSDKKILKGDPLKLLRELLERYHNDSPPMPGMPIFYGGAVGYLGYDAVRSFERLPDISSRDIDVPDMFLMIFDTVLIFDNLENKIKIVSTICTDNSASPAELYTSALGKIDRLVSRLRSHPEPRPARSPVKEAFEMSSNFSSDEFVNAVLRCKEYIRNGDIIQVVISQRFENKLDTDPFDIYRVLRLVNPSPYMFFLRGGGVEMIGSSPELLVRIEAENIDLRPIAGTRKRGKTVEEDADLEKDLLADEKERSEHIMLVDLGRNDVGRVSEKGTVTVEEFMKIERYSHVMHIVSHVHGRLRGGLDYTDALRSCFPAGTLTGAPKIRAMEIIEEIEPCRRATYGGAVGYIGFSGNMDMCITIRTILIREGRLYVQAGAGIVADSDPESEYNETINKARGMFRTIELAREGLE